MSQPQLVESNINLRRKQTCRKRTATRNIAKQQKPTGRNPFAEATDRLAAKVDNEYSAYRGPTGLGRGKGGQIRFEKYVRKEAKRLVPRLKHMEKFLSDREHSIPLAPFVRLIKGIVGNIGKKTGIEFRLQAATLHILRDSAEGFLVEMFETSLLFIAHANRVTLMPRDLELLKRVNPGLREHS